MNEAVKWVLGVILTIAFTGITSGFGVYVAMSNEITAITRDYATITKDLEVLTMRVESNSTNITTLNITQKANEGHIRHAQELQKDTLEVIRELREMFNSMKNSITRIETKMDMYDQGTHPKKK